MSGRPLHVLVGVAPSSRPDALRFADDLRLVKAALLYGDAVTLCSPAAALVARVLDTRPASVLDTLVALADDFDLGDGPRHLAAEREALPAASGLASERLAQIDRLAAAWWRQVRGALLARLHAGGYGELIGAAEAGTLRLDPLGTGALATAAHLAPVAADAYATRVDAALTGLSVPLLDAATLDLIRQRAAGVAEPSAGYGVWRGREGGLVADWLPRLPLFDAATLAETLDVRRELEAHVARFRAAVVAFAEAIGGAVWDAGFRQEAERLFRRDVAPAVLDIEEAIRRTGPLRALVSRYAERPGLFAPTVPALALGMAGAPASAEIGAAVLAAGSVAANAAQAWWTARDARRDAEANRLFFYYAASERLSATRAGRES